MGDGAGGGRLELGGGLDGPGREGREGALFPPPPP